MTDSTADDRTDAILAILAAADQPLAIPELLRELRRRGVDYSLHGGQAAIASMCRAGRLRRLDGHPARYAVPSRS
jgi:hypothetical protein